MSPSTSAFASRRTACFSLALAFFAVLTLASVACTQQSEVKLVSLTSPVRPGNEAKLRVTTTPQATCQIAVRYKSGTSKAQGLVSKRTDKRGRVGWTWRVGTTPGTWPITVTCSKGSVKGTLKTSLVVR